MTFRHLLSHTSGIRQRRLSLPSTEVPKGLGWDAMRELVELGTFAGLPRRFDNANFALLGIANACR